MSASEHPSDEALIAVLTERKDPRNADSTYRLLAILRSEPDASLFQVPSDYTVRETGIRRFDEPR